MGNVSPLAGKLDRVRPRRSGSNPGRLILTLAAASCLAGCAGNALRVEGAATVGRAAGSFTQAANAALDDAKVRRIEANAALVASDASCEPADSITIYMPDPDVSRPKATTQPVPFCGTEPIPGYVLEKIDLRPWGEDSLKPTIVLIGAVGDYGAALSKVAERPDADIGKELVALGTKADEALALANGLLGLDIPSVEKALASKQATTALALLDFVAKLAAEQAQVKDIRAIVDRDSGKVMGQIPKLKEQLADWVSIQAQGDAQIFQNSLVRAYRTERQKADFPERLAFVTAVNKARADAAAYPQRLKLIEAGLDKFVEADADLRRMLKGDYNAKERKRIAELNQQRFLEAFGLMARALGAFGGL